MQSNHRLTDSHATPPVAGAPGKVGDACTLLQFREAAFPGNAMSPFVLVDDFTMWGPTFPPHPHAGMSAVTLMLEDTVGSMTSLDSIGHNATFGPGDLHWTLAGRGIVHTQVPTHVGDRVHALQIFVNLPARLKGLAPDSFHVKAADMPVVEADGSRLRVVAGEYKEHRSSAVLPQQVAMFDATLQPGAVIPDFAFPAGWNAWVYVLEGQLATSSGLLAQGQSVCVHGAAQGLRFAVQARQEQAHFIVLAGERIDEPLFQHGPFVMHSREALERAILDYQAGRFGTVRE